MLGFGSKGNSNINQPVAHVNLHSEVERQIAPMEMTPDEKTRLARFVLRQAERLDKYLLQWQCGIVAVRVNEFQIKFGIMPHVSLVKTVLASSAQISHALQHAASVEQLNGKLAIVLDVPFAPTVPNFAQLQQSGRIQSGSFLFGYHNGKPLRGQWQDVLNIIVAGLSQSGKTTTTRFLLAQAAVNGAQFVIVDPHAHAGEKSLSHSVAGLPLIAPIAVTPEQQLQAIQYAHEIGKLRIAGNPDRTPVMLVIDEANTLFDDAEISASLIALLREIARAYSKVGVNAICIGHDWRAVSTGGSGALRGLFQSRYLHRLDKTSARTLISNDYATAIEQQKPGQAHLALADGTVKRVIVPETTNAMLRNGFLAGGTARNGSERQNKTLAFTSFVPEMDTLKMPFPPVPSRSQPFPDNDPMVDDVLRLFVNEGLSIGDVTKRLYGTGTGGGRRYVEASQAVQDVLRQALGGMQL